MGIAWEPRVSLRADFSSNGRAPMSWPGIPTTLSPGGGVLGEGGEGG